MRFREFKLTEQQLDELKMSPGSLGAFAKSPVAQGIKAGFEAEMIFPGMAGEGEYEPDYDEDTRPSSIDEVIEFFSYDGSGFGMGRNEANRLRSGLEEEFWEYNDEMMMREFQDQAFTLVRDYIETHDFDFEEAVQEYLKDEAGLSDEEIEQVTIAAQDATSSKQTPSVYREATDAASRKLDELAEESISNQDGTYDTVLDEFRDDYDQSDNESDWLSNNYRYMSDIENAFGLSWPYWRGSDDSEGYNEDNAEQLADDLSKALGVKTRVSGGYHSAKRDDVTWIFEPDGSLSPDDSEDMPVEIVSPPMPLDECLKALNDFFSWAKGHNAYTNSSTGFHMGVSLPNVGGKVDFVKLALFLGDEYVLNEFGRKAVAFCESAIKKIKNRMKGSDERVADAMNLMRKGLIDVAHNTIASDEGFGKYTSINPKGNYIEFRSAGGEDYFKDIPRLRNMLLRYAQAMVVAADPAAEKKEYYKKLYKLIAPATGNATLDLFARFAAGTISKEELKNQWATAALEKETPAGGPGWEIFNTKTGETLEVVKTTNRGEAMDLAMEKYAGKGIDFSVRAATPEPKASRRLDLAKRIKGPPVPTHYIKNDSTGEFVFLYSPSSYKDATATLEKYRSLHQGNFVYGLTRFLTPDEIAQGRKNTEADTAMRKQASNPYADDAAERDRLRQERERIAQELEPRHPQQVLSPNGVPMWEIYNRRTGLGLHQFADHTQNLAWQTAQQWAQEQGFANRMDILSVRPVMPQV